MAKTEDATANFLNCCIKIGKKIKNGKEMLWHFS